MPELAFREKHNRRFRSSYGGASTGGGGGGGARDFSPDSVIYSIESSFSQLSSSASASIDHCSSNTDVIDHDSLVSDMSQNSSGGFRSSSSVKGLDPDPNTSSRVRKNGGPYLTTKKVEKTEAIKEYNDSETDGEIQTLNSARSSFSHTTKDFQNRKSRTEILLRKSDRRRPASLDLNIQSINITSSSPRLVTAMKSSVSVQRTGTFPSPGTPNYRPANIGFQKGWSSERVPLHTNTNRITSIPFNNNNNNNNGRTLPSKWEDAERWIISPVAGDNGLKPSGQQPQIRVKSKSGPLGPVGPACLSMYSPVVASFEGTVLNGVNDDKSNNLLVQNRFEGGNNGNFCSLMDHYIARSVSVHGCSELLTQSMLQITQDDKNGGSTDAATNISRDISRRDMATQMSPESSPYSSPNRTTSTFSSNPILAVDSHHFPSSKSKIKDVQVDDQVTLNRSCKKNICRILSKKSDIVDECRNEGLDIRAPNWDVSEMKKSLSKVKREEAKITAWENLQKAKAEAEIRKLEMKLEKKRSSSMDRIMHKLRYAQKKAQEMRESVLSSSSSSSNQPPQVATSSHKVTSLIKTCHISSITSCFTCPAF